MLKKEITYENFDGEQVTRPFYFNLSAAEMAEMELGVEGGGLAAKLNEMMEKDDRRAILGMFKDIIIKAYGERDGESFMKSPELAERFSRSPAFDALFFEMVSSEDAFSDFCKAIVPKQLRNGLSVELDTTIVQLPESQDDPEPWITEDREPTKKELTSMTRDQLVRALKARDARRARLQEPALDPEIEMLRGSFDQE